MVPQTSEMIDPEKRREGDSEMSSYGAYSLQLSRQRLEEVRGRQEDQRKQRVRQQVRSLLADSRRTMGQFQNNLVQQFGQEAQRQSRNLAQQAERFLQSNPDRALLLARKSLAAAQRGLTKASGRTAQWTKQKDAAQESVTVLRLALDSMLREAGTVDNTDGHLTSAVKELSNANAALRREDFKTAMKVATEGQKLVESSEQIRQNQQEQEEIRRQLVRGLRQVLGKMNFAVEPPHFGQGCENGKVVLTGTLPSGRTARFVIALDGQTRYDFDGYRDRACEKDLAKIRRELEQLSQAKTSDIEMHWKDEQPIRIDKTALDLPSSHQNNLL